MEIQGKLIMRARLIASGTIRYWEHKKSMEVRQWCEILAEELVKIEDQAVVRNIRESVLRYGLHLPEPQMPSQSHSLNGAEGEMSSDSANAEREPETSPQPITYVYIRRTNNQVSEYTEAHIRELLSRGLTKSAVARALRVNRRVVIRVWREAQNAQRNQDT